MTFDNVIKVEKMNQIYKDSPKRYGELPPWLALPVDNYDMGVVKAQWWAEREYGEGIASR